MIILTIPIALSIVTLILAAATLGMQAPLSSLVATDDEMSVQDNQDERFPEIDWQYWKSVNPDVIGWLTIPGTNIDQPILKASTDDPEFYLHHDIHKKASKRGSVYLDSGCVSENGSFSDHNNLIYGHNMLDKSMFSDLQQYSDAAFATSHDKIYLQTPDSKFIYEVAGAKVVDATMPIRLSGFESPRDFKLWKEELFADLDVRLSDDLSSASPMITLCSCSYSTYKDERTLVFAQRSEWSNLDG